jgi:hypothetical protein
MALKSHSLRGHDDSLVSAIDSLRKALAPMGPKEQRWVQTLGVALAGVEQGLHQRLVAATAQSESPTEVVQPTSARQMDKLSLNESDLLTQVMLVREKIRSATRPCSSGQAGELRNPPPDGSVTDFENIRLSSEQILAALEQNKETETKLIQETVNTDIGVGD